jgi:hypothetical protein
LSGGRVIARHVDCDSFQDASAFMAGGGERGPQMALIAPGTYRINPFLFSVQLADATVMRTVGDAEASKTRAVGGAEAEVIKLKIASMESGNYAVVQVAEALAKSGVKLVPDIVAGGGATSGTLVDVLLTSSASSDPSAMPVTFAEALTFYSGVFSVLTSTEPKSS